MCREPPRRGIGTIRSLYDSIALSLSNDDTVPRSVYLNSVCNMEHERGGFTLHLDGAYATACDTIFQWWKKRVGAAARRAAPGEHWQLGN